MHPLSLDRLFARCAVAVFGTGHNLSAVNIAELDADTPIVVGRKEPARDC
jgi:hypothetical protein